MTPGSSQNSPLPPPLNLNDSLQENENELITDEGVPSEYSEERVQGLVEEMEKISVSNAIFCGFNLFIITICFNRLWLSG